MISLLRYFTFLVLLLRILPVFFSDIGKTLNFDLPGTSHSKDRISSFPVIPAGDLNVFSPARIPVASNVPPTQEIQYNNQDSLRSALIYSFQQRNLTMLRSFLAPDFSVGVYTLPAAERLLEKIVEYYAFDSLVFGETTEIKGLKKIKVSLIDKENQRNTFAYLNANNQLLYIDLFDQLYGVERHHPAHLKASIPFEIIDDYIVVTVTINNSRRPVKLLFDTGADGMALNKNIADSLGLIVSRKQNTAVVGGEMQVSISSGNTVHLNNLELNQQNIALFDHVGDGYDGIIGNNLCKRYITRIDFDRQILELFSFGEYTFEKGGTTLQVRMPSGVPVIPATVVVGQKKAAGSFVFDTGAKYYLIGFGPFVKNNLLLTSGFIPYFAGSTISMGQSSATYTGNFSELDIGTLQLHDFPGVLQVYKQNDEKWTGDISGSLGIKSIRKFNVTINLADKQIHLMPNRYTALPYDFVIKENYLSFKNGNELWVDRVAPDTRNPLMEKDVLIALNGITIEKLIAKPRHLKKMIESKKPIQVELLRDGNLVKCNI